MQCPYCQTENRDDEEKCYHCTRDLSMLRLIVNKAKHHFNQGLELAERGKNDEAIVELKNALDLDASLVNARVVLGTLYAKQERFEEARLAWAETLALDHRFQKAHEYLAKAALVEEALPSIKRQRKITLNLVWAVVGMGVVLSVVIAIQLGKSAPPSPAPIARQPVATSGTMVVSATPAPQAPPVYDEMPEEDATNAALVQQLRGELDAAHEQTRAAQRQVELLESQRLDLAVAALADGADETALDLISRFRQSAAGQGAQAARAAEVERQALDRIVARLASGAEGFFAGSVDYETFAEESDRLIKLAGAAPQAEAMKAIRKKVDQASGERMLAAAGPKIDRAALNEAVRAAAEIKTRRPDLAAQVDKTLGLRLDAETTSLTARVKRLNEQGDFTGARQRVERMALVLQSAGRSEHAGDLEALRRDINQKEAARQLAKLGEAIEAKEWDRVLAEATAVHADALDAAGKKRLDELQTRARRGKASAEWQWFQDLDPKFTDERITAAEATRATAGFRSTIENLPADQQWAKAPILFYAAVGWIKLGDAAKAAGVLKELDALPKIPGYLKPAIKQFKAAHGKELGLPPEADAAKSDAKATGTAKAADAATTGTRTQN